MPGVLKARCQPKLANTDVYTAVKYASSANNQSMIDASSEQQRAAESSSRSLQTLSYKLQACSASLLVEELNKLLGG